MRVILIIAAIGFLTGVAIGISMAEFPEPVEVPELPHGFKEAMKPIQVTGVN